MSDTACGEDRSLARLVGFSDGIFGFAMTLLAIDLVLPRGTTSRDLPQALASLGPHFFAFALSFGVVGLYWAAHRRIFRYIVRSDDRLLYMNLILLLTIAFMPFPTAVEAEFGSTTAATVLYSSTLASTGLLMTALWVYATYRRRLVSPDLEAPVVREHLVRALGGTAVFGLSIPVAFVNPTAARYVWFLVGAAVLLLDIAYNGEWVARRRERA